MKVKWQHLRLVTNGRTEGGKEGGRDKKNKVIKIKSKKNQKVKSKKL